MPTYLFLFRTVSDKKMSFDYIDIPRVKNVG